MPKNRDWDKRYKSNNKSSTPWERGYPDEKLVDLVERGLIKGQEILDVCSGLGTQAIYLARQGFNVFGIEISPTAIRKSREKAKNTNVDIDFRQGNVQKLPFSNNTFDFILDRGCLHHQYEQEMAQYLQEIKRVLKPGGRVMVLAFAHRFTPEEIRELFKTDYLILEQKTLYQNSAIGYEHEFNLLLLEKK